jgi:hypothetical protein
MNSKKWHSATFVCVIGVFYETNMNSRGLCYGHPNSMCICPELS